MLTNQVRNQALREGGCLVVDVWPAHDAVHAIPRLRTQKHRRKKKNRRRPALSPSRLHRQRSKNLQPCHHWMSCYSVPARILKTILNVACRRVEFAGIRCSIASTWSLS